VAYTTGSTVTRVQQRIRDTGYSSSEIKSYLNDTQNDVYNEYHLRFMEDVETYTLVVGNSDVTNGSGLPTNYVQALDMQINIGYGSKLTYIDAKDIVDTTTAGIPTSWYIFENTIRVHPVPSSAYTVTLRYYKKPTELENDTDVPEVPSEFQELLVVGAAYRVMQVKDNYDQAAILQNKYDELLQKLVVKYSQSQVGTPTRMRINRYELGKTSF
jgi:hypothetical protein